MGITRFTDDLGVKEVTESNAHHCKGDRVSQAIDRHADGRSSKEVIVADTGQNDAGSCAVTGQTTVPELEYFDGISEVAIRLIKEAVSQSRTHDNGYHNRVREIRR